MSYKTGCPRCGRGTYSAKWKTCTAQGCSLNPLTLPATKPLRPTEGVRRAIASPVVGDKPSQKAKAALRQKEYRARKKATA